MDVTSNGLLQANATIIAGLLIFVTITSLTNISTDIYTPASLIFPNPVTNLDFNIQLVEKFLIPQSENPRDAVKLMALYTDLKEINLNFIRAMDQFERLQQQSKTVFERSQVWAFMAISLIPFAISSLFACITRMRLGILALSIGFLFLVAGLGYFQDYYRNEANRISNESAELNSRVRDLGTQSFTLWNQTVPLLSNITGRNSS